MIQGIHLSPTDRNTLDSPELAIEIMSCLHHLYPTQFPSPASPPSSPAPPPSPPWRRELTPLIYASWQASLAEFRMRSRPYLLYH